MPYITEKRPEGDYVVALANFASACNLNAEDLDLTPAQVTAIQAASTAATAALTAVEDARNQYTSAVTAKNAAFESARNLVSQYAKTFRADSTISDALLAELNVAPHYVPGVKTAPNPATEFYGVSNGLGDIRLSWNRNGNIQGTTFIIESRAGTSEPWQQIWVTTRSYFDTTWAPGSYVSYRIRASRNDVESIASTPIILWDGETVGELQIAA